MKKRFLKQALALILSGAMIVGQSATVLATEGASLPEDETQEELQLNDEDDAGEASSEASSADEEVENNSSEGAAEETDESEKEAADESTEETTEEPEDASEEGSSEDESGDEASLEISDEILVEAAEDAELPEGIVGMPEGYTLTADEIAVKKDLIAHDVLESFEGAVSGEDYVSNEVICTADSREHAEMIAAAYSGKLKSFSFGIAVIDLSESPVDVAAAYAYGLDPDLGLPAVEPNFIGTIIEPLYTESASAPALFGSAGENDQPGTYQTWEMMYDSLTKPDPFLNPSHPLYQWHLQYINAYAAWNITRGSSDITVAVIDTGFTNYSGDFDDYRIIAPHKQANVNGEGYRPSASSHGTHVAGIIGASLNNEVGGAGVAPGVSIMPINVFEDGTESYQADNLARAINYVAGIGDGDGESFDDNEDTGVRRADIINMSLGGIYYSNAEYQALQLARERGITVVVSMGNSSGSVKTFPGGHDNVIAVGAVSFDGKPTNFSSTGSWAAVSAPGQDIYSTSWESSVIEGYAGFEKMSGTSQAAPIISGACALYMSVYGNVGPDKMEEVIKSAVKPVSYKGMGTGIIDLAKLFNGETTPPTIEAKYIDNGITTRIPAESGTAYTSKYLIPDDATISVYPGGFGYDPDKINTHANDNTVFVYTTDGSIPVYSDGEIKNGKRYEDPLVAGALRGCADEEGFVTLKAIAITGMGVVSGYTTLKYKPELEEDEDYIPWSTVEILGAPRTLVAGKSVTLKALVKDGDGKVSDEKVTWAISAIYDGDLPGANINASGKLTTKAKQEGTLVVTCTTVDSKISSSATIDVKTVQPVKTMTIAPRRDMSKYPMIFSYVDSVYDTVSISITKLIDTKNSDLLDGTAWKDISFRWTSSNENVAVIDKMEAEMGSPDSACIKAVGAGTANIICEALDGSGKKASYTIKVIGDKAAGKIGYYRWGVSTPTTTLDLYFGVKGLDPSDGGYVHVSDADGNIIKERSCDITLSTSNPKIATVAIDKYGEVTVTPVAKGTAKITISARDNSGIKTVLTVNVHQYVTDISITGQDYVTPGSATAYKATVLPANADKKTYTWVVGYYEGNTFTSYTAEDSISIDDKGNLTVGAGIEADTQIVVRAVANDWAKCTGEKTVLVRSAKASSIKFYGAPELGDDSLITTAVTMAANSRANIPAAEIFYVKTDNNTKVSVTSSNPKVVTVEGCSWNYDGGYTNADLTTHAVGKAVITATALDGSGKKATMTVNVIEPVQEIQVTGQRYVMVGTSAAYKATITIPGKPTSKKLNWMVGTYDTEEDVNNLPVLHAVNGVSIDNKGKVTVAADAKDPHEVISVVAYAADGGFAYGMATFVITPVKATGVTVDFKNPSLKDAACYKRVISKGTLSSLQLFDTNTTSQTDDDGIEENKIVLEADVQTGNSAFSNGVEWTCSNWNLFKKPDVGEVYITNDTLTLVAKATGTATITCTASDGSGKKTSFKVTVITPVSNLNIRVAGNNTNYTAYGKSASLIASAGNAYGKPSNTKVTWDYEICKTYDATTLSDPDGVTPISKADSDRIKREKRLFTLGSNGKVTVNSKYWNNYWKYYSECADYEALIVKAIARAADGSGAESYIYIYPVQGSKSFSFIQMFSGNRGKVVSSISVPMSYDELGYSGYVLMAYTSRGVMYDPGQVDDFSDLVYSQYYVTSSNDSVVTAAIGDYKITSGGYTYYYPAIYFYTHKKGTAKITVTAKDGTNKKKTITVKVR